MMKWHKERSQAEWDLSFMTLAKEVAKLSKDPSSKFGAILVDKEHRFLSMGFNGFPRGVSDHPMNYEDRNEKLWRTIHAEENAVLFHKGHDIPHTMYIVDYPCAHCMAIMIQVGIQRIVVGKQESDFRDRWLASITSAKRMAWEAGVELEEFKNISDPDPKAQETSTTTFL
jgi:dCMP deaminase